MGVWKSENTVVTDAGMNLLASLTGKKEIELSRVVAGADYTDFAELTKLTAITHVKKEMSFSSFSAEGDGTAIVDVYIDNAGVEEEFYHQQIGIYAKGPSGGEVLFFTQYHELGCVGIAYAPDGTVYDLSTIDLVEDWKLFYKMDQTK